MTQTCVPFDSLCFHEKGMVGSNVLSQSQRVEHAISK